MEPYMKLDGYGRTTIRNIYYDTDTYRLIRRSLEKPAIQRKTAHPQLPACGFGGPGLCRAEEEIQVSGVQAQTHPPGR